jgi:hypothetical protein
VLSVNISDAISETMFTELCRARLLLKSGLSKEAEEAIKILDRWAPFIEDPKIMAENGWDSK